MLDKGSRICLWIHVPTPIWPYRKSKAVQSAGLISRSAMSSNTGIKWFFTTVRERSRVLLAINCNCASLYTCSKYSPNVTAEPAVNNP